MRENNDYRDYYDIGGKISDGFFGTVYEAKEKNTNEKRAIKIIEKNLIKKKYKNKFFNEPTSEDMKPYINCFHNEIRNMVIAEGENKDNENAVKFYEFFENDNEFAIVMELCDDNILNYLPKIKNEEEIYEIINQLNKTIKIMVESKLVYIDIKIENILLKYINEEKTKYIVKLKLTDDSNLKKEFNKLFYCINNNENISINAPEILKGEDYNEKSDLWSMGVIIYVLLYKHYPYEGSDEETILNNIKSGGQILEKTENSDLNDLIRQLLIEDPEKRITWEEYFNHPLFIKKEKKKKTDFRIDYELGDKIGEAGFANVYKGKLKGTDELKAIKIFDKNKIKNAFKRKNIREMTQEDLKPYIDSFLNEINNMKKVEGKDNENINTVQFYDFYDNENEFIIVMELCDDNFLAPLTKKKEPFNSDEIYDILIQLNNSFKIMVNNNLVHRALNLNNILVKYLDENKLEYIVKLKLTNDSCLENEISKYPKLSQTNFNLNFIAPEILKKEYYNEKCDLWSLGIIIYTLAFRNYPFNGENGNEILKQIKNIDKIFQQKTGNSDLDDLIKKLLVEEPQKRLNWNDYFKHSFFRHRENVRNYYSIMDELGNSDFATVYKAQNLETNELRAIKIFDKNKIRKVIKRKILREPTYEDMKPFINGFNNGIKNMKIVDKKNNNTVKYYEYFNTRDEFAIVMELCDENLLNLFSKKKNLFNSKKIYEILSLLNISFKIMAQNRIIHRALNLENILVKYENVEKTKYTIKLKLNDNSEAIENLCKSNKADLINGGDLFFKSPEILKGQNHNEKCDLWSLGVVIYILAFKENPFKSQNISDLLKEISNFEVNFTKKTDNPELDDLIKKLLVEDPQKRLTWNEYFNHPFFIKRYLSDFRSYYDITKKIGESGFAIIYSGNVKGNKNELRAIKIFDKNKIISDFKRIKFKEPNELKMKPYIDSFNNEMNHMKLVEDKNNENTVQFYEYFHTKNEYVIVMELCDDNLLNIFAKRNNPFNIDEIYDILMQLNNSFKIMSQNNLVHRAINLDNILIKYQNEDKTKYIYKLKLTNDSGLLKDIQNITLTRLQGDLNFIAPEILKKEHYNEKCDLWSLGVLIYVLSFRKHPFVGVNELEILGNINKNKNNLEKTYNSDLDNLIEGLLVEDPTKRLTWNQYFNHSFFKRNL